ncbi:hypothetical protein [Cerasicoccus frondis]|uniref:hypothetical protein n=1 Tax=Cerasicoccus frondis TaxID=490090 RepID=UPI0028528552|nr:hypothetical protein [Cerasicoccus frondis]
MRRLHFLLQFALLVIASTLSPRALAATGTFTVYASPTSRVQIDVQVPWELLPYEHDGYYPILIHITNGSKDDGRWQVSSESSSGYRNTHILESANASLEVPAGDKRTFRFLCPLANSDASNDVMVNFTGTSINQRASFHRSSRGNYGSSLNVFSGLSDGLYNEIGVKLVNRISSAGGGGIQYTEVTPGIAPEDWRAYLAFDQLLFSQQDWDSLSAAARRAILDWVLLAGELRILVDSGHPLDVDLSDIPDGGHVRGHGMGKVIVFNESLDALNADIDSISGTTTHSRQNDSQILSQSFYERNNNAFLNFRYSAPTPGSIPVKYAATKSDDTLSSLLDKAAEQSKYFEHSIAIDGVNFTIVILSVIAFGLIVGPVNFFVFARGRNRWRVFITIPVISLAFCLLIIASIILGDGFGGDGKISRIVVIDPIRKIRVNIQDELSVTGILMGSSFNLPDTATYRHIGSELPNSTLQKSGNFALQSNHYQGDYYKSRRLQWNRLINVSPSREAVLVKGGEGQVTISSNLQANCRELYYIDDDGDFWRVQNLGVGRSDLATSCTKEDFQQWWQQRQLHGGVGHLFSDYRNLAIHKGWFYALAEPMQDAYPETLTKINWENHQTIIAGPVVNQEGN